jgi:DNA polymerase-1
MIRQLFVPRPGHIFVVADYDQMELRVAGYLSGDPNMRQVFLNGDDIHAQAGALMYRIPLEQVTKAQRGVGKTQNFAVLYGAGEDKIAQVAGTSKRNAIKLIDGYYAGFPMLEPWKRHVIKEAIALGDRQDPTIRPPVVIIPPYGRKRRLPGLFAHPQVQMGMYNRAVRQAINSLVQGMASNITKMAMINLAPCLPDDTRMLAQVHDEILVETPIARRDEILELVPYVMSNIFDPKTTGSPILGEIPLKVSVNSGFSWAEAK